MRTRKKLEHLAKDAQTGSKKVFTYIKRKKVVTKLIRWVKNKSLYWGRESREWSRRAELAGKLKKLSAPGCIWRCWGLMKYEPK